MRSEAHCQQRTCTDIAAPEELGPQHQLRVRLDGPMRAAPVPDQVALNEQRPPSLPVPALRLDVRPDPIPDLQGYELGRDGPSLGARSSRAVQRLSHTGLSSWLVLLRVTQWPVVSWTELSPIPMS